MAESSIVEEPEQIAEAHTVFSNSINFFPMMMDQHKTQEICCSAFNHNQIFFKYIPDQFITIDMCWKGVTTNIKKMYEIPTIKKTIELCNYAARIQIELILHEKGIPLTHRRKWMYHLLIEKQLFFISHIPEIYIPLALFKSSSSSSQIITQHLKKTKGKSKWINTTKSKLLHRCVDNVITTYEDHIKSNINIKKELLIYAWAPYRTRDWCMDTETQARLCRSFLL